MKQPISNDNHQVLTVGVFKAIWEEGMQMITSAFEKVATKEDFKQLDKRLSKLEIQVSSLENNASNTNETLKSHGKVLESLLEITSNTDRKLDEMKWHDHRLENHEKRIEKLEVKAR